MGSANIVVQQDRRTLTAGLTSDRDGAEIRMTVTGLDEELDFRNSRPVDAPVHVNDDHGRALEERRSRYHSGNSRLYRLTEGPTLFQRIVALDRIDADVRSIELFMDGAAGEWRVTIPVEPRTANGPHGVPTNARAVHHGIAIAAQLVARTKEMTAIELASQFVDEPDGAGPRAFEGISSLHRGRALGADLLILRDNTGAHHLERPHPVQDHAGLDRRREVALFEPMPAAATSATLEVPYVAIRDLSDEIALVPVPGESDVTLAGCRAHVVTSRIGRSSDSTDGHPSPIEGLNGPCVRIVITPDDPDAERQLVSCGVIESNDRGMTVSVMRSGPPVIEVPDPTGDSAHMTLRGPVLRVQGPWKLEFSLPNA